MKACYEDRIPMLAGYPCGHPDSTILRKDIQMMKNVKRAKQRKPSYDRPDLGCDENFDSNNIQGTPPDFKDDIQND